MLRRPLLLALMLAFLGFGAQQSSSAVQLSTGRIAYHYEASVTAIRSTRSPRPALTVRR
jgi:hypothetical protein